MSKRWITAVATALLLVSSSVAPALALGAEETVPVVKPLNANPAAAASRQSTCTEPAAGDNRDGRDPEGATGADEPLADGADAGEANDRRRRGAPFRRSAAGALGVPRGGAAGGGRGDPRRSAGAVPPRCPRVPGRVSEDAADRAGGWTRPVHCAGIFRDAQCWTWYAPYVELAYRLAILEPVYGHDGPRSRRVLRPGGGHHPAGGGQRPHPGHRKALDGRAAAVGRGDVHAAAVQRPRADRLCTPQGDGPGHRPGAGPGIRGRHAAARQPGDPGRGGGPGGPRAAGYGRPADRVYGRP